MLERWLNLLPNDIVYQDPELLILTAWTHLVFFRYTKSISCLDRAEGILSAQSDSSKSATHLLGHHNGIRVFWHYLFAEGEQALICAERARKNIPRKHRWPRNFVSRCECLAYQMVGNSEKAQFIIEEILRDEALQGESS